MIQKICKGDTNENFRIRFPENRKSSEWEGNQRKQRVSIRVISKETIPDFQKDNPNPKGKRKQVKKGNVIGNENIPQKTWNRKLSERILRKWGNYQCTNLNRSENLSSENNARWRKRTLTKPKKWTLHNNRKRNRGNTIPFSCAVFAAGKVVSSQTVCRNDKKSML